MNAPQMYEQPGALLSTLFRQFHEQRGRDPRSLREWFDYLAAQHSLPTPTAVDRASLAFERWHLGAQRAPWWASALRRRLRRAPPWARLLLEHVLQGRP